MYDLDLYFHGVNAYVPHTDGKKMAVIMPNATCLGKSRRHTPYNEPGMSHLPTFWPQGGVEHPDFDLAGRRVILRVEGDVSELDATRLASQSANAWLDVKEEHVGAHRDPLEVSSQFFFDRGVAWERPRSAASPCRIERWSDGSAIEPVISTLRLQIKTDRDVHFHDVETGTDFKTFEVSKGDHVVHLGNVCAEDVLGWPQPAPPVADDEAGTVVDSDISWLFNLRADTSGDPPRLTVSTLDLFDDLEPGEILRRVRGPGGGNGCECNSMIARPIDFAWPG